MKKRNVFSVLLFILCFGFILTGCGDAKYTITFMVDNAVYSTVSTQGNETIEMPTNPSKDGFVFDGWYWDNDVWSRPFTANSLLNEKLTNPFLLYLSCTLLCIGVVVGFIGSYFSVTRSLRRTR